MTNVQGAGAANSIQLNHEPLDTDGVTDELAPHVQGVEDSFLERVADLEEQIASGNDPQRQLQLEDELMKLQGAFDDFRADVQSLSDLGPQVAMSEQLSSEFAEELEGVISDFRQEISASYAEFGTCEVPADAEVDKPGWSPVEGEELGELSAETVTIDHEGGAAADVAADVENAKHSTDELVDMLQNDPDAFRAAAGDLDQEDMMAIQNKMQQINQLFSMMTQFSQAMHDTSKAVIQNLRV